MRSDFRGFLTLYGVWWTIENNKKDKREEISVQYLPILQIESKEMNYYYRHDELPNWDFDETGKPLTNKPPINYDCFEEHGFACELVLKNTGRGEIVEIDISCCADDKILSVDYKFYKTDILPQDSIEISFIIDIHDYKKLAGMYYDFELKIEIKYLGIMNIEYLNTIPIHILNQEPFEWYVPSLGEVVTETNNLLYEIGNIKRTKCQIRLYAHITPKVRPKVEKL